MVLTLISSMVLACPVCGQAMPQAQTAYQVMSIIISLLPLAMIGGIILWIYFRARAIERNVVDLKTEP